MTETCVIFGGSSGIGEATAARLLRSGRRVVIVGRDAAKLASAAKGLAAVAGGTGASGGSAAVTAPVAVDASLADATDRRAIDAFFARLGPFDHLVLSISGGRGAGLFLQLDLDDVRSGLEAKFFAQLSVVQAACPSIRTTGSVTLVSAGSSRAVRPGVLGLGAINAALESTVPKLALELAPLRVNAVSPGVIQTPWWDRFPQAQRQAMFDTAAAEQPARRIGQPDDVAQTIVMLVENGYITGTVIDVDGGGRLT